jgi:hypothetical protein
VSHSSLVHTLVPHGPLGKHWRLCSCGTLISAACALDPADAIWSHENLDDYVGEDRREVQLIDVEVRALKLSHENHALHTMHTYRKIIRAELNVR